MALRRGFKSEAERIATQAQADLGLNPSEQVEPFALAQLLGVDVRAGDELVPRERFVRLNHLQPGAFSACTFRPSPSQLIVVYNPLSSRARRNSDLAHELSHVLLDHELGRVEKLGDLTFLTCDPAQEDEAAWLSGCLLLPPRIVVVGST